MDKAKPWRHAFFVSLRVVNPESLSGEAVDGRHLAHRCAGVQDAIAGDRGGFEEPGSEIRMRRLNPEIGRFPPPGNVQPRNVGPVNLR